MLTFHKMQGAGNDFIVLDLLHTPLPGSFDFVQAAQILCDRHFGAGSDGLLTLESARTEGAAARMRMWNPDGSEDMCGNGLRCVAALAWERGYAESREFKLETFVGLHSVQVVEPGRIRISMGCPVFAPSQVPFVPVNGQVRLVESSLEVGGETRGGVTSLSTGSTHTVIFLEEPLDEARFQRLSPLLENHARFPERTNVMWAVADGPNRFRIRIWERGANETLACGTGACAVAVAANLNGRASGPVAVESRGGVLGVEWSAPDGEMYLTGPVEYLFEGQWRSVRL